MFKLRHIVVEKRIVMQFKHFRKQLFFGMIGVAVLGTLFHFAYDFTGQNRFVGLFVAVNESTWEHMKLMFFPMLLLTCFLAPKWREEYANIDLILNLGNLTATWLIPILFYTYRGILGYGISWVDISTFYISEVLSFLLILHLIKYRGNPLLRKLTAISFLMILIQGLAFMWFTYHPPGLGIFMVP